MALAGIICHSNDLYFAIYAGFRAEFTKKTNQTWQNPSIKTKCVDNNIASMDMVKRGDLYYADLSPVVGSEQGGVRPVLIVQNNVGNKYSPTIIAAAVTSQLEKAKLPTHIMLEAGKYGLPKDSVVLLEQIRTLDKRRLKEKIGELPLNMMTRVNEALLISLGFFET